MKRILILSVLALMVSCMCISQIPDQTIYVDQNCEAILPNYMEAVIVSDNCEGVVLQQTPDPGSVLDAVTPVVEVTLTATDAFANQTSVSFTVTAVDTIYPTIIFNDSLDFSASMDLKHDLLSAYYNSIWTDIEYAKEYGPDSIYINEQYGSMPNPWKSMEIDRTKTIVTWQNDEHMFASFYPHDTEVCFCDSSGLYANAGPILSFK